MGIRGELFSNKIILPNRTYFFNVKENRMGDLYLNIVESKNRDSGGFDRQSVILFADDLQEFLGGFDESLRAMEKAMREKRHSGKTIGRNEEGREKPRRNENERGSRERPARNEEGREPRERSRRSDEGHEKRERPRRSDEGHEKRERPRRSEDGRDSRERPRRSEAGRESRERPRRNERQGSYNGDRNRGSDRKSPGKRGSDHHSKPRSESGERFSSDRGPKRDRRVIVRKRD